MSTVRIQGGLLLLWIYGILAGIPIYGEPIRNGFNLGNAIVPVKMIKGGGPKRDAIPALDNPLFIKPEEAEYLKDEDLVVSVNSNGKYRAYPIRILNHHEIVNDSIGEDHFTVTYCPLCGTAMVFKRTINGRLFDFGGSGMLYESDVLLYDRQTESLWSQLGMKAVTGPMVGEELPWMVSELMTWEVWKKSYPDGEVLSKKTGYDRPYFRNPYAGYAKSKGVMFNVSLYRTELAPKTWVLGVKVDEHPAAYELALFPPKATVKDTVKGVDIYINYDPENKKAVVTHGGTGEVIPSVLSYWFAWHCLAGVLSKDEIKCG